MAKRSFKLGEKGLEKTKIDIGGKHYELASLTEDQLKQVESITAIENRMREIRAKIGIANTTRNVYIDLFRGEFCKGH